MLKLATQISLTRSKEHNQSFERIVKMKGKQKLLAALVIGALGATQAYAAEANSVEASSVEDSVQPRIIGGSEVSHSTVPYQVALTRNRNQFCGGTLIAPNWVLTAAHCLDGVSASQMQIRIGATDLRTNQGEYHNVSRIHVHEQWSGNVTRGRDIALLRLSSSVSSQYKPAKLPTPALKAQLASPGSDVKVSGWGRYTRSSRAGSPVLKATNLPVISNAQCSNFIGHNTPTGQVPSDNICGYDTRSTACHGDSGGPFVKQSGGDFYVFGAVSWGSPQCDSATAFADVTQFVPWITRKSGISPDGGTTTPPADACSGVASWQLYKQYSQGDRVIANGSLFESNVSQWGVNPFSDHWGYWNLVQTCN